MHQDDDTLRIDPRPLRPRRRDDVPQGTRPIARQLKSATKRTPRTRRSRPTYRIAGRNYLVAKPGLRHQQVTVKTHIWYNRWRTPSLQCHARQRLAAHLKYITREAAGPNGRAPRVFGSRDIDERTLQDFTHDLAKQPHMFRFIVSPERSAALDLEGFTRDLMQQLGADLGIEPDWIAAVHDDTKQPHVHIELAGKDRAGRALKIHEDYLFRGLRYRAQELATDELGFRRDRDLARALEGMARAPRLTQLDRALMNARPDLLSREVRLRDLRRVAQAQRGYPAPMFERQLRQRLTHLGELGLAREIARDRWTLHAKLEARLRELGRHGDVLKEVQLAGGRRQPGQNLCIWNHREMVGRWTEGRVTGRQRADELTDREVLTVEAVNGKTYLVGLTATSEQLGRVREGDLVRVSGGQKGYPNVYLKSRLTLEEQVRAVGRTWLDEKLVQVLSDRFPRSISRRTGMGPEVAAALESRKEVLRRRGLLVGRGTNERLAADALAQLYEADVADFHHKHSHRYGARHVFIPDLDYSGHLEIVQLASGPHAVLVERGKYRLTPLRPQMVALAGQQATLRLSNEAIQRPLDRRSRVTARAKEHRSPEHDRSHGR